ncbi:MAG: hypothetical protein IRZ11_02240 [Clostridia bacterium]|nr:hypothetical protein [Clostridia bacterium]
MPRTLLLACAALLVVAAGCSQVPSGVDSLPLPTFAELRLPQSSPFREDVRLVLPTHAALAVGAGEVVLAAGGPDAGLIAPADGRPVAVQGGLALAAGGALAIFAPAGSETEGARTYAYGSDGRVRWSTAGSVSRAWVSADGRRAAVLAGGRLLVLDGASGHKLADIALGPAAEVSFAEDGAVLAADGTRLTLVGADGTVAWTYKPGVDVEFHAALSPDGDAVFVATGDGDDTVYAFRASGKTSPEALLWKRQLPRGAGARPWAVSPDGDEVAVAAGPDLRDLVVLAAATGDVLGAFALPEGLSARGAAFGPDGRLLVLASPRDQATPAVKGWAPAGEASAGGPGALALAWAEKRPAEVVAVPDDALLAPDGGWLWSVDRDGRRAAGMRLGEPSH